jgi:hypothetical protein
MEVSAASTLIREAHRLSYVRLLNVHPGLLISFNSHRLVEETSRLIPRSADE